MQSTKAMSLSTESHGKEMFGMSRNTKRKYRTGLMRLTTFNQFLRYGSNLSLLRYIFGNIPI